jgi:chromosome segregation ATPase
MSPNNSTFPSPSIGSLSPMTTPTKLGGASLSSGSSTQSFASSNRPVSAPTGTNLNSRVLVWDSETLDSFKNKLSYIELKLPTSAQSNASVPDKTDKKQFAQTLITTVKAKQPHAPSSAAQANKAAAAPSQKTVRLDPQNDKALFDAMKSAFIELGKMIQDDLKARDIDNPETPEGRAIMKQYGKAMLGEFLTDAIKGAGSDEVNLQQAWDLAICMPKAFGKGISSVGMTHVEKDSYWHAHYALYDAFAQSKDDDIQFTQPSVSPRAAGSNVNNTPVSAQKTSWDQKSGRSASAPPFNVGPFSARAHPFSDPSLLRKLQENEAKIANLKAELAEVPARIDQKVNKAVGTKEAQIRSLVREFETQQLEIDVLERQVDETKDSLRKAEEKSTASDQEIQQLKTDLDTKTTALNLANQKNAQLEQQIGTLKNDIAQLNSAQKIEIEKLEADFQKRMKDLSDENLALRKANVVAGENEVKTREELQKKSNLCEQQAAQIAELTKKLEAASLKGNADTNTISDLQRQLTELKKEASAQREELEEVLAERNSTITSLQGDKDEVLIQLKEAQSTVGTQAESIKELEQKNAELDKLLQDQKSAFEKERAALKEVNSDLQKTIDLMDQTASKQDEQIKSQQAKLNELTQAQQVSTKELEKARQKLESLNGNIARQSNRIKELKEERLTDKDLIDNQYAQIKKQQAELDRLKSEQSTTLTEVAQLTAGNTELQAKLLEAQSSLGLSTQSLSQTKAQFDELQKSSTQQISDLQDKVKALTEQLKDKETLAADKERLTKQLSEAQLEINALKTQQKETDELNKMLAASLIEAGQEINATLVAQKAQQSENEKLRGTIESLQGELSEKTIEAQLLAFTLEKTHGRLGPMEALLKERLGTLERTSAELYKANQELEELRTEGKVVGADQAIKLNEQAKKIEALESDLKNNTAQLEAVSAAAQTREAALRQEILVAKDEVEKANLETNMLLFVNFQIETEREVLLQEQKQQSQKINSLRVELNSATTKLEATQVELTEVVKLHDSIKVARDSENQQLANLNKQVSDEFKSFKAETAAQIDKIKKNTSELESKLSASAGELKKIQDDHSATIADLTAKNEQLTNELVAANKQLNSSAQAKNTLEVKLKEQQGQVKALQNKIELLDNQLLEAKPKAGVNFASLNEALLNQKIALENQLKESQQQMEKLSSQIKENEAQYDTALKAKEEAMQVLEVNNAELTRVNEYVESRLTAQKVANQELKVQLEQQNLYQIRLDASIAEQSRQLYDLNQSLGESDALNKELQTQLNAIRAFPEMNMSADELRSGIDNLNQNLTKMQDQRKALESDIVLFEGRLEGYVDELVKKQEALAGHAQSAEKAVASLKNATELTQQMETIRGALDGLESVAQSGVEKADILAKALQRVAMFAQEGGDTSALGETVNTLLSKLGPTFEPGKINAAFAETQGLVDQLADPRALKNLTDELKELESLVSVKLRDTDQSDAHRWLSAQIRNLGVKIGGKTADVSDLNRAIALIHVQKTQMEYRLSQLGRPAGSAGVSERPSQAPSARVSAEISELKGAAIQSKNQVVQLQKQLELVSKEKDELQTDLNKTKSELEGATKSLTNKNEKTKVEAEKTISKLKVENAELEAKVQSFAKVEINLRALQNQLEQQSKELDEFSERNLKLQQSLDQAKETESSQSLFEELGSNVIDFPQDENQFEN